MRYQIHGTIYVPGIKKKRIRISPKTQPCAGFFYTATIERPYIEQLNMFYGSLEFRIM